MTHTNSNMQRHNALKLSSSFFICCVLACSVWHAMQQTTCVTFAYCPPLLLCLHSKLTCHEYLLTEGISDLLLCVVLVRTSHTYNDLSVGRFQDPLSKLYRLFHSCIVQASSYILWSRGELPSAAIDQNLDRKPAACYHSCGL